MFLKHLSLLLAGFAFSGGNTNLPAAEPPIVQARDGSGVFGHKATPKLPWCEWVMHDPDRPVPRRVNPGPALSPAPAPADAIVLFDGRVPPRGAAILGAWWTAFGKLRMARVRGLTRSSGAFSCI